MSDAVQSKLGVFVLQAGVLGTYNFSLDATQRAMESAFGNPAQFGGVGALPALGGVVQAAGIVDPNYGYDGFNSNPNPFNQGPQMPQSGGADFYDSLIAMLLQNRMARQAQAQQAMAQQMQMQQQMAALLMFAKFFGMDDSGQEDMPNGIQQPAGSSGSISKDVPSVPGGSALEKAANLIAGFEKFRDTAYWDGNGYAVGYGSHTIDGKPVQKGQTITKEKALQALQQRIREDEQKLDAWVRVPLNADQKAGLLSFMYNAGAGAIKEDGIVASLNEGDYDGAARKLEVARRTSNKTYLKGLAIRRTKEASLVRSSGSSVASDNGGKQQKPPNSQMSDI